MKAASTKTNIVKVTATKKVKPTDPAAASNILKKATAAFVKTNQTTVGAAQPLVFLFGKSGPKATEGDKKAIDDCKCTLMQISFNTIGLSLHVLSQYTKRMACRLCGLKAHKEGSGLQVCLGSVVR